jgi:hypothetical protein
VKITKPLVGMGRAEGEGGLVSAADARWALVERIASSQQFEHSDRLRELLLYISRRSLEEPGARIHENEIGCGVFARPAGFDTGGDTIVRVHASRLRRRLEQYFNAEGKDESIIVTIPKGGYNVVWQEREVVSAVDAPGGDPPLPTRVRRRWLVPASAVAATAVLALIAFAVQRTGSQSGRSLPPTAAQQFWQQFWANEWPTHIVISDSNLSLWSDMTGQTVTLADYMSRSYEKSSANAEATRMVMSRQYTSVAATLIAARLMRMAPPNAEVVFAREATARQIGFGNAILLGSARSNPWVETFAGALNFEVRNEAVGARPYLANRKPRAGELARYDDDQYGYGHIAFLPNLNRGRNVVILSGTEMQSTEAAGVFLSSPQSMTELQRLLEMSPGAPYPYFEVVIQATRVGAAGSVARIVAVRVLPDRRAAESAAGR